MVHAQFLIGEGFEIVELDQNCYPPCDPSYDADWFRELVRRGVIGQPPVSSDELQSRSKSDWIVKLIAILQILYFASQTIFRAIQHIQVTPLEILVVAFIFCSLLSYTFNWSKPQDVEYPVVIEVSSNRGEHIKSKETQSVTAHNSIAEVAIPQDNISRQNVLRAHETQSAILQPTAPQPPERQSLTHRAPPRQRTYEPIPIPKPYYPVTEQPEQPLRNHHSPAQPRTQEPLPPAKYLSEMSPAEREAVASHRPPQPRAEESLPPPGPYDPALAPSEKTSRLAEWLFAKGHEAMGFYCICMSLSTLFGAIHCAGWNSPFPSHAERVIWRVCAIMTTALATPCIWTIRFWLEFKDNRRARNVRKVRNVMWFLGGLYVVARMLLMVLAFTTLRALPAETYETVEWTRYLPNFSS